MPLLDRAKSIVSRAVEAQMSQRMASPPRPPPPRLSLVPWGVGLKAPRQQDRAHSPLSLRTRSRAGADPAGR